MGGVVGTPIIWSWDSARQTESGETNALPLGTVNHCDCLHAAGLIANRDELRRDLGLPTSISDIDLILRLYDRFEVAAAGRIAGCVSFVVHDRERGRLLAVADRSGRSRLYYLRKRDLVVLAPEIKALLPFLDSLRTLDRLSIAAHVCRKPISLDATYYEGVRAVEPGTMLVADHLGLRLVSYWRLEPQPLLKLKSDDAYAEALQDLLSGVIGQYLDTESFGITLSGGLDSTAVAAVLRRLAPKARIVAFRWVAPDLPEADESGLSVAVARGLDLEDVALDAGSCWTLSAPDGIQTSESSPFYNCYTEMWQEMFTAAARRGIRVLFTGLSGDHLFGGNIYAYPDLLLTGRWWELVRQLQEHLPHSKMGLRGILSCMVLRPILRQAFFRQLPRRSRPVSWLGRRLREVYSDPLRELSIPRWMLPGRAQRFLALLDPALPQANEEINRMAGLYGIDVRSPLLDHRLIEFATRLPTEQTFRAAVRKVILRNAMRNYLPETVVQRRTKIYPDTICFRGLRERETAKVWALLTDMRAAELGYVHQDKLREVYRSFVAGEHNDTRFWNSLTLEAWLRRWF
ncbi:MAG: hypothetical protein HY695_24460 [Deltaproteobacteria bacterium]|nr:hypothetical protein [Deltaproteobacteria bacterium]